MLFDVSGSKTAAPEYTFLDWEGVMERMGIFAVDLGYASGLFHSMVLLFSSAWVPTLHLLFISFK